MNWKILISILVFIFLVGLLVLYWFIPFDNIKFQANNGNSNFSLENDPTKMQFYSNMRYSSSNITYTIDKNCSIPKKDELRRAISFLESKTILKFSEVNNGEISVMCENKNIIEGNVFVAGEGGPSKVVIGKYFTVILNGRIILIRTSDCKDPIVALHELLHALGFDHSDNENNIMYPISNCGQIIGDDIVNKIDELYKTPSYPDLNFENVSATLKGRLIDMEMNVVNDGLKDSGNFSISVYVNDKEIKKFYSEGLEVGYKERIDLTDVLISQISIKQLKFVINTDFNELDKNNNNVILTLS